MSRKTDDRGEDSDHAFLDDVLNRLYDFGDGNREKNKRKSHKSKKSNEEVECTPADGGIMDSVGDCTASVEQNIAVDLDCFPKSCKVGSMTPPIKRAAEVEIVMFQNPSKKKKAGKPPTPKIEHPLPAEKRAEQKDFSLEKARLEVHRFGITGYQKEQQRLFEQERAIMLGAKPPKREYINYKLYQQMIKEKKQKAKEEPKLDNNKKKRQTKERNEKGKSSSKSIPTGQVGRFKNGMLVLSTKEIQRIKSSKVVK
ncbi:hypothetical protein GJAV_G00118220 [Gymnothorax javanicus]|nr:hypothetical protein GJAV_G00118220 [Gymnothorax javanicus]